MAFGGDKKCDLWDIILQWDPPPLSLVQNYFRIAMFDPGPSGHPKSVTYSLQNGHDESG